MSIFGFIRKFLYKRRRKQPWNSGPVINWNDPIMYGNIVTNDFVAQLNKLDVITYEHACQLYSYKTYWFSQKFTK